MSTSPLTQAIHIVGGGLAGSEAAWQLVQSGIPVIIHEMKPSRFSAAHKSPRLAELVCSNSLKSEDPGSAPYLLKQEMLAFSSLVLDAAYRFQVPAGGALAVDRNQFSEYIHETLAAHPLVTIRSEEISDLPDNETLERSQEIWLIATGPLTADSLAQHLSQRSGLDGLLYFYDSIAPIIAADSILEEFAYRKSRYDKGGDDYLNIPLNRQEYETFIQDIKDAEKMALHSFEEPKYFESCLPIEVMVERGDETLRFGPMKPVGLEDPKTGRIPHAAIQLRAENKDGTMFSMVGFQTKMKWPEQKRVFSKLPALQEAEFLRFGTVHRNTYVHGPKVLNHDLSLRASPRIFLAGQITGVEGYTESSAMGILAGRFIAAKVLGKPFIPPPATTIMGALHSYVTGHDKKDFAPMNSNLGLLPAQGKMKGLSKKDRKLNQCLRSKQAMQEYISQNL